MKFTYIFYATALGTPIAVEYTRISHTKEKMVMPVEQGVLLIGVGLLAGVLSGMFGIGGGAVIVPILIALFQFDPHQANGTSLAALLMPVGIFAVLEYRRRGKLNIATSAWVAGGLLFGGFLGANVALGLSPETLMRVYGVFLLYVSWRFVEPLKLLRRVPQPLSTPAVSEEKTGSWPLLLLIGFIAGIASGMFGIGGGLVIVPALVTFLNFDQHRAVGTSLGALLLPVALPAVVSYYQADKLDLGIAFQVALGLIGGAFVGARIALSLPSSTVKRIYGVFLLIMGLRFIFGA
jgi:hypothetical protein